MSEVDDCSFSRKLHELRKRSNQTRSAALLKRRARDARYRELTKGGRHVVRDRAGDHAVRLDGKDADAVLLQSA